MYTMHGHCGTHAVQAVLPRLVDISVPAQSKQTVVPVFGWYFPSAHKGQCSSPLLGCIRPTAQSTHSVAAVLTICNPPTSQ